MCPDEAKEFLVPTLPLSFYGDLIVYTKKSDVDFYFRIRNRKKRTWRKVEFIIQVGFEASVFLTEEF